MTTMINPQMEPLSDGLPGAEPMLLMQRPVPPRLVRRVHNSDVFVTDLRVTGFNSFQVGVRWPAAHPFYGPTTPFTHDPLLFLESLRQAGLLIARVAFDIPSEFKYVTHEKEFDISPAGLRTNGSKPVDMVITVTAHDIRRRGRGFAGMRFEFGCFRDGVQVGTAAYRWSCVSAAGYNRLRGEHGDAEPVLDPECVPVRPEAVGRRDPMDVMVACGPSGWELRIDPAHPVVFDHAIDHVPGNGAIEVARQAALLALGQPTALPIRGELTFTHYIEFDSPC
ncbi:MAG: ScbA/BarX family gamma-butyrolactone biosynthesis protein, partial [Stackebrandtia sp.]